MRARRMLPLVLGLAAAQFAAFMAVYYARFGPAYIARPAPLALDSAWTILCAPVVWAMVIPSNIWNMLGWKTAGPPFVFLAIVNSLLWGYLLAQAAEAVRRRRAGPLLPGKEQ